MPTQHVIRLTFLKHTVEWPNAGLKICLGKWRIFLIVKLTGKLLKWFLILNAKLVSASYRISLYGNIYVQIVFEIAREQEGRDLEILFLPL